LPEKKYIQVTAVFHPDGKLAPISYIWDDQEVIIEKVLGSSLLLKPDVTGVRYACVANGKEIGLIFDTQRWRLETE
jgi:hypothetical protein